MDDFPSQSTSQEPVLPDAQTKWAIYQRALKAVMAAEKAHGQAMKMSSEGEGVPRLQRHALLMNLERAQAIWRRALEDLLADNTDDDFE